jgi:hypothetical protein
MLKESLLTFGIGLVVNNNLIEILRQDGDLLFIQYSNVYNEFRFHHTEQATSITLAELEV